MEVQEEKKVEYIELIYDLIFVYLIGKNASLLDRVEGGFVSWETFVNYLASSLIVLQIWNYTTLFVNRYGKNGVSDKLMMLTNMFLLYIMGVNTIHGWNANYAAFMGAWALILLNIAAHYLLKLRSAENGQCARNIRQNAAVLLVQAALIGASIPLYAATGLALGPWALLVGFAAVPFLARISTNFAHLTERVMLYVAEYFADGLTLEALYFALASFLIVAGLFFSYGYLYDRLLDRSGERSGSLYMLLHVFIILSLSCVTTSLEFMRDAEIHAGAKNAMLVISLLAFFLCLALTEHWSVRRFRMPRRFLLLLLAEFAAFAVLMILCTGHSYAGGAVVVVFIYAQLLTLRLSEKHTLQREA